jgi:hypothetical protein
MDAIKELNRTMASHLISGNDKAKSEYIAHMRTAVVYLAATAHDLQALLSATHASHENALPVMHANRDFLNAMRLASKDVFAGRPQNLVIFDIDIRSATILAQLTNQQVNQLAYHWPGHIFGSKMDQVDAGKDLHPDVVPLHAISLGDSPSAKRVPAKPKGQRPSGQTVIRDRHSPIIPIDAEMTDPKWRVALLNLAEEMVLLGAKPVIIKRYTGVRHSEVTRLYRTLTGGNPPIGPLGTGGGHTYASPRRFQYPTVVKNAVFAGIYARLARLVLEPVNKGWLLVYSMLAYQEMVQIDGDSDEYFVDINTGYKMVTYCGLEVERGITGELGLSTCSECGVEYLVATTSDIADQKCPVCTYSERLHQGRRIERQRRVAEA